MDQLQWLTLIVGTAAPVLVGLTTKASWSPSLKAVLLLTISAVTGFLSAAIAASGFGPGFDWQTAAVNAAVAWVIAVATHYGLYKPTGVTTATQRTLIKDHP
jgi:hypothetical protein